VKNRAASMVRKSSKKRMSRVAAARHVSRVHGVSVSEALFAKRGTELYCRVNYHWKGSKGSEGRCSRRRKSARRRSSRRRR
jgi:hypothetical protein